MNLEKPTSPASSVRTAAQRNVSGSRSDEEPAFPDLHTISPEKGRFRRRVTPTRFGDLTDFEDLFYMIWHKVLTLYHDLQLRYACGFLTLQSVIHNRSITLRENKPLTVREFAWYLQLVWQELTDPELIASMDRSLRSRIITKDLLPGYDPDNHTEEDGLRIRMAYQNRAFTRMPHAPGLKDVSRASPIDIINQVYKKHGIILDCEKEIEASDNSARAMRRAGIKYIQKRTEERVTGLSPDDPRNFPCTCSRQCPCKDLCIVEPDGGCLCKMRPEFYSSYEGDMAAADSLEHEYGATIGEHSLWGAGSNEEAQLQVATAALSRDPEHSTLMIKSARDAQNLARKLEWEYVRETMKTPTHGSPMSLDKPLPDLPPEPMTPCPPSRKRLAGSIKSHVKRFKVARKPVGYEGGYSCY